MSSGNVEDRIQRLEQKVRQLEEVARSDGNAVAWWERIAGAFEGDEVYAAAMKLGGGNAKGRSVAGICRMIVLDLRRLKIRIGTMDLKIAASCLCDDALLLTRNTVDYSKVPGLRFEDWTQ